MSAESKIPTAAAAREGAIPSPRGSSLEAPATSSGLPTVPKPVNSTISRELQSLGDAGVTLADLTSQHGTTRDRSWHTYVKTVGPRIESDARRRVGSWPTNVDYQDVAQEVLLALFTKAQAGDWESLDHMGRASSTVTRNKAVDHRRTASRHREDFIPHASPDGTILDKRIDKGDGPERRAVEGRRNEHLVQTLLEALPERRRDAVVDVEMDGMSHAESVDLRGGTEGSSRVLLHRGNATMRDLAPLYMDPSERAGFGVDLNEGAWESLSGYQQKLLTLKASGLSDKEIATRMGKHGGTISDTLRMAERAYRSSLQKGTDTEGSGEAS